MDGARRVRTGDRWALFLDFDGTLVDIAERPDAIFVEPSVPRLLSRLRERLGGAVALVTGRAVGDVDAHLPGIELDICGLHGLERRLGGRMLRPEGLADLRPEIAALRATLAAYPGLMVEDKGVGVAVHWRMAPEFRREAVGAIDEIATRLGAGYRVQNGKAVREIVPAGAGKGEAIRVLAGSEPYHDRTPLFAGDDVTDEDGFAAVNALGGSSIKVGDGVTAASFRAPSGHAFRHWLAEFAEGRSRPDDLPLS